VAQELNAICQPRQVRFVDAAIANGVASMAAGKITFLVGGEPDDVAKAHPTLEGMAEAIMHLGPVGQAWGPRSWSTLWRMRSWCVDRGRCHATKLAYRCRRW